MSLTTDQPMYKWIFTTEGRLGRTSPAMAPDGAIYVGASDCRLYALSSQGKLLWKCGVEGMLGDSTASVADDGTIYICSDTGHLYALNPEEELSWSTPNDWLVVASPALTWDGTVVFGVRKLRGHDGKQDRVIATNHLGESVWEVAVLGGVSDAPTICSDGTIYVGTGYGYVYAITAGGKVKHKCRPGGRVSSAPAIRADSVMLLGTQDRCVYAISSEMEVLWSYKTGEVISYSSPAIAEDGTVYFGSWDHCLYALSEDGKLKWKFPTGLYISSSPAVAADGTVYFGSQDNHFYALWPEGGLKWKLWTDSPMVSSPLISQDGVVLVCTKNRRVRAIDERNGGPARSAWPMLRGGARRSGRQIGSATAGHRAQLEPEKLIRAEAGP